MRKVPTCPGCGAKFSHNSELLACNKCGLPDEIASRGGKLLARWKSQNGYTKPKLSRRRNKHGRVGVKK